VAERVTVLLASRNAKKLVELRRVIADAGIGSISIVGLDEVDPYPEKPETAATFEQNALAKARDGAAATGLACVADDSGIAVEALNGMPGVLSARWAGKHGDDAANNALLLAQLADVPDDRRRAHFVSACALVTPQGVQTVVRGQWLGSIAREPVGAGSFGYDPVFRPEGCDVTAAQLSPDEKDAVSHRGQAMRRLLPALAALASPR
jgi:XTP/dITP diphosphohydrolase